MFTIGARIGRPQERSAICVAEAKEGTVAGRTQDRFTGRSQAHFFIRRLERLPVGLSFPAIAERVAEVAAEVYFRTQKPPDLYVDATGLSGSILELVEREVQHAWVLHVCMNHGNQRTADAGEIQLGKAWLVARLQSLLQTGQLHLPRTPRAEQLAEDLLAFEVKVSEGGSDQPGAFPVGRHDDLVTALGLAVQEDPPRWSLPSVRYG